MATVQDLLDRTLGNRGTTTTEPTQISNANLNERAGVGTFIPQLPKVLNDQRQNNIEYEKSKVDHANPLLTTANLNNSNPLISVPANALNMAGSVVANTIQGGRNVIGLGHEFVAKYHEAGLPEEAAVMQGSADSIEAELSVLRKELENPTVSGNPGARMKLIADITKKRAELIQANDTIRQSGYKDQIEAVKHNRKMGQLYADRTKGNSPDVLWNNKQRLEVNAEIESEINQWKKENPDANFAEETAAASRITAGHLTDNPAEIIGSAVDSVASLLRPETIVASAVSQGSNFLIQQQEKYNEKKGIAGESLIPGGVQAGIAAGTAAYVGLNFYADKVLANAAGLSKSPVDKAVEAATEVVAKGGTKAAAARTAEKVAAPTVKRAIATGAFAAAQEYPVEGISAMMEENLGHGGWTFDGTVFGRGGTQGVMAGGIIAAPATAANTLEAASAQLNIKANENQTDTSSKKYNPVADIAQAYTDVVESGAAATPEQVTAARDKAKTVLATTQERLDNLLQIKQDIKETDLTAVLAQRMDAESDSIQSRFDNGEIDEATATSLMEGLDKKYNAYAAEVVKYRGKESKLDNELRIVRNNLQASTQYHTKMSENVGLAPDTVKAIQDRQKIVESRTATPEDIARAIEDIIAYPMVATTKQIEQAVASGNLTTEIEKILRTISASKQLLQGETSSVVRKQIEHGAQGYRGLREYSEAFNVALIDNDEKAIGRIQRGLDSFLQSHTTKQQAISEALNQVPNGVTWQVARDRDYNWYIRKDNLFSEEKRKSYGAFNVHKGSGKLLKDVTEEVALIQAQIDLVKASLELRQQAPVQPQDMANYNKIKYSQKTPLTHAEAQAKVAKLDAALSPENKTFAVGRDGNLHLVQVKRLHASDASKVIVSIDDSGKEYSPKLDDLVIMDQNGNDLFDTTATTETEVTTEPVELDPQETSWDNLDEPMPSDQDGDIEYDYTPTDIDYREPDEVTSTEPASEPTITDEQSVAETEPTQSTETGEAVETQVTDSESKEVTVPVEAETATSTTTVQRTVKGSFYLDDSDTLTEGTIDIADGSVVVRAGDKEVTVKVTPEQLNNETRLSQAIARADSSIELAYSNDLVPKDVQLARAQEVHGDDVSLEEIQQLNHNAEDEIISREDGSYDEVKLDDAKGLLEVFLDEASTFTKNFRQVGSKLYAKPFITIKDFFPSLDWNAPKRAEYLAQLLSSDTSKLDDHDFTTMKALRDFHMGMTKGNSFRDVVLDRLNNTEQLDPKLNLASHLVVQTEDGKLAFEENVLGAMSVAAYDYILKNQDMLVNSDAGINFMLSIPVKDSFIKGTAAEKYRRSTTLRDKLIYELGESVTTALGIKVNSDVSPDELRKLNSALGIYVYDAMKGRFITENVVYEYQILTDVANHVGYTVARDRYNNLMEVAGVELSFKDFRKLHKQYVETIKENRIGYISQKGSKPEGVLDFATKVTKNIPRIPTFRPENLVGNPKEVQAFIELAQQLRAAHGVLNTPKYLAGIAQDQKAIDNNKRQRKNPNYKPQQELARSVSKVTQGVPSRSETIHKIFGLDKSLITPLSAPVRFLQRTIKKSLAEVSDAQAKALDAISQKPLKVKPFSSVVSNLAQKDYELLKDIIGANPALDTIHISHRDNAVAKAANIERELELALNYVDSITNEDGSYNNFYHELVVWSNNRFGYRSNTFNLQTSKIARSMSTYVENVAVVKKTVTGTSTRSIFNKDKQLTEYGKLLHGVAVYAEDITAKDKVDFPKNYLGDTTIDKAPNEVLLPLLHKRLTTEFKDHFAAVRKLVNNETLESTDRSLITELVSEMGAGIQSLEAAVELVRYWDTPKGKTFESHLTVESDGITNGMIINQIQNGTATLDMLVQAGILTDAELSDNPDADFFQLKGYGWLGKKLTDYYVRAGNHQKENWEKLKQALSLETFDDNASEESNVVNAIAFIDSTFGERKGAKAFATPDNYAAGLGRIKEIVGEYFTDNLIGSIEKSINKNDPEKLGTIMKHVDTLLKFHDTYLTSPDMVNLIYKKGGVPTLSVTLPDGMSQKQLRANLAKRAVLMANSTGAEQGKVFQLKAKDLSSYREMVGELSEHFSANITKTFRIESLEPVTDMNMGQLDYRLGMIIAATKPMFNAVPVGTLDYSFINTMTLSGLMDVKFITDEQMAALNAVSNITQGTATVLALKEMNGNFYRVREANLSVMNAAYRVHQVIRKEVIDQAISRRLTKVETLPENYKDMDAESLLTVNDWKEINQILSKFLPTGQTAFSRKSKNSEKSGAVFLDEGNKLFTSDTYTQEVAITKDGKTTKYKTGVYKPVDKPVGLKGNSSMTQSVDAYVTTNASTKVISGNFHDSNGYNIASYQEGAKAQNEVFFEALVNHSAQNGFAEAVLNPLKAFLEDSTITKSENVISALTATLTEKNDISDQILTMYNAELDRLSLLSAVSRVQQYGTEDGHYDVPQEIRDQIQEHLAKQRSADTPMMQLMDIIADLGSKVKNPSNPSRVYVPADVVTLIEQEIADYDSGNNSPVVQGLRDLGSTNIPASKVVGLIKEYLNNHEGEMHPFYSQLIDLVEAALPNGIEVNVFTPTRIPKHVRGDRVIQYERDTQGWFTGNQVNLVYSARNELTVETLVHELVHAALVNFVKQGLKGKDKNPAATDLVNLMANVREALEADPRFADIVADYQVALHNVHEFVSYGITNQRFMNALKSVYIPQTNQHKTNSKHSLAKRLVNAFSRFTELAVELLLGKTPKYKGKGKDAHINALAALTTTVALNLQEAAMSNAKPDMDFDTMLQHVANANAKSKEKIKLMTPTQVYEKLNAGNLSSSFDQQLRTEALPLIEAIAENISTTEVGKMFKESVNPETIWDDAQINNKVPYVSSLLGMGFPLSDKEAYTVETLEASLNAIIDYSYGSTVHREMDRMYIAARNNLKPEHFHEGDWATATIREKMTARERWDQLFNLSENMDNERRNRFLTRFMALSLGSEHFNKILNNVPPTQDVLEEHETIHGFIANRFHRFIDWLAQRAARTGNIPTIQGRIKVLAEQLAEIDAKRKNHLLHKASKNPFGNLDALGEGVATAVRNSIVRLARLDPIQNSSLTALRLGSESVQLLAKNNLEEVPDQIMKLRANMHPSTLPGFLAETAQEMGRPTGLRKKLISMISRNNAIQRERETMRQHIEKNITEMFVDNGEYLETEDWKAITNVVLRTGLSRLYFEEYEPNTIFEFISSNKARRDEINELEDQVLQLADGSTKLMRTKHLADYMVTGIAHELQAKNTLQIAGSVGVSDSSYIPDWFDSDVKLLNRLASLYAIEYSNKEDIKRIKKVLEKESLNTDNGVERLLNFHQKLGNDSREMFKDNPLSQAQAYVPEIHNTNREIAFATHDGDVEEMVKLGYQEVIGGTLKKADYDTNTTPVRMMYTMNSDKQRIVDGVAMLNTTDGKGTEIAIEDIQVVTKHLARKLRKNALQRAKAYDPRNDREVTHGVPQLNAEGEVVGMTYEMTNALRDSLLERDNHPAKLMGEYAASNLDLQNVEKINFPIMDALFQDYQFNYKDRPQDYVELSHESDNPELVRMYRMLPYTTREYLKGLYGDSPIMVNANVLTITLGYRKYTPTEIFRKNPNERNVVEATFAGMMQAMFKDKAAVRTTQALKATMEIVKLIKDFYVIRNFTTLFNNILSNNAVLLAYGVSPLALARDTKVALQAGLKFKKDYSMYIQYKTKVALGLGDMTENKQKMMYYEDSLQRNPLKAFIDEGMMTSIVEDIEQSKDDYSYQAALENKFKGTIEAIPKPIRETVNFVMVNQGTPLHRMLTDTTAMSDFVAKYVLYNYHTKKKGMSHAEAIFESHEAFINYEVPTNKALQFLNDIGLVMFTKYALRIQRVVYRLLRDKPASVILQSYLLGSVMGMPAALDGFIPHTGNLPFSGSVTEAFSALGEPIPLKLVF